MYNPYNQNNGINWVQGENGARSWIVAPNNTVLLMDSEENKFYIKTADISGMPNLRAFEYTEISPNKSPQKNTEDFITRTEWDTLVGKIDALERKLSKRKGADNEQLIQSNEQ